MSQTHPSPAVSRQEKWRVALILLLVVLLGSVSNIVSPLFEPPDERLHYQFVRDLLDERALPVQLATAPPSQNHQPPLYYLGGALLVMGIPDDEILPRPNPFWAATRLAEVSRDNKRQFLPHPAHQFPYRNTALVVHLLRLWSTFLAAATAVTVWYLARLIWPHSPPKRLAMAALVVLNPMFLYLAGSVNNDNLIIFLGSLLTALALAGLRDGFTRRRSLLVGVVWGLALLTKLNGLVLAAVWGAALLWAAWRRRSGRFFLTHSLLIGGAAALAAGWWFWRNLLIYGDPLALNILLAVWGERVGEAAALGRLWRDTRYAFTNFWGRFGYGQIPLPALLYGGYGLLCAGALAGSLRALRARRRLRPAWLALGASAVAYAAAFFYFLWRNPTGANGRYVFPALSAYAALLVAGLSYLFPSRRVAGRGLTAVTVLMALLATLILSAYLPWVYAPPATYADRDELPGTMQPLDVTYPQQARLIGYELEPETAVAGQELTVTLYWQALQPISPPHHEFVQIVSGGEERLAGRDTHPGLGNYPTTLWQPGQIIVDPIPLSLPPRTGATGVQIDVGLVAPDGTRSQTDEGHQTISIGPLRLGGSRSVTPPGRAVTYHLDDVATLISIDSPPPVAEEGDSLSFQLTWQAQRSITTDYHVFVHLVGDGGLIAAYDAPPGNGHFPTRLWQAGDTVVNTRRITLPPDLPPGRYRFLAGWYNPETLARLPATTESGAPLPDNAIPIFEITVE